MFRKVVVGAFFYVYLNRIDLLKALSVPFIAYLIIGFVNEFEIDKLTYYFLLTLSFLIQTIFAITTHRIILLGKESVPKWGLRYWSKRETFFLIHVLILTGGLYLLLLASIVIGFIPIFVLPIIFIFWVWGRLSLVFPGIAIDKGVSFKMSWALTRKYQLLMFLVVIAFPTLLALPSVLLNYVPYTAVLINIISTFVIVFEVSALSVAYQLITSCSKETLASQTE